MAEKKPPVSPFEAAAIVTPDASPFEAAVADAPVASSPFEAAAAPAPAAPAAPEPKLAFPELDGIESEDIPSAYKTLMARRNLEPEYNMLGLEPGDVGKFRELKDTGAASLKNQMEVSAEPGVSGTGLGALISQAYEEVEVSRAAGDMTTDVMDRLLVADSQGLIRLPYETKADFYHIKGAPWYQKLWHMVTETRLADANRRDLLWDKFPGTRSEERAKERQQTNETAGNLLFRAGGEMGQWSSQLHGAVQAELKYDLGEQPENLRATVAERGDLSFLGSTQPELSIPELVPYVPSGVPLVGELAPGITPLERKDPSWREAGLTKRILGNREYERRGQDWHTTYEDPWAGETVQLMRERATMWVQEVARDVGLSISRRDAELVVDAPLLTASVAPLLGDVYAALVIDDQREREDFQQKMAAIAYMGPTTAIGVIGDFWNLVIGPTTKVIGKGMQATGKFLRSGPLERKLPQMISDATPEMKAILKSKAKYPLGEKFETGVVRVGRTSDPGHGGFIRPEGGGPDVFVHYTDAEEAVAQGRIVELQQGQALKFRRRRMPDGRYLAEEIEEVPITPHLEKVRRDLYAQVQRGDQRTGLIGRTVQKMPTRAHLMSKLDSAFSMKRLLDDALAAPSEIDSELVRFGFGPRTSAMAGGFPVGDIGGFKTAYNAGDPRALALARENPEVLFELTDTRSVTNQVSALMHTRRDADAFRVQTAMLLRQAVEADKARAQMLQQAKRAESAVGLGEMRQAAIKRYKTSEKLQRKLFRPETREAGHAMLTAPEGTGGSAVDAVAKVVYDRLLESDKFVIKTSRTAELVKELPLNRQVSRDPAGELLHYVKTAEKGVANKSPTAYQDALRERLTGVAKLTRDSMRDVPLDELIGIGVDYLAWRGVASTLLDTGLAKFIAPLPGSPVPSSAKEAARWVNEARKNHLEKGLEFLHPSDTNSSMYHALDVEAGHRALTGTEKELAYAAMGGAPQPSPLTAGAESAAAWAEREAVARAQADTARKWMSYSGTIRRGGKTDIIAPVEEDVLTAYNAKFGAELADETAARAAKAAKAGRRRILTARAKEAPPQLTPEAIEKALRDVSGKVAVPFYMKPFLENMAVLRNSEKPMEIAGGKVMRAWRDMATRANTSFFTRNMRTDTVKLLTWAPAPNHVPADLDLGAKAMLAQAAYLAERYGMKGVIADRPVSRWGRLLERGAGAKQVDLSRPVMHLKQEGRDLTMREFLKVLNDSGTMSTFLDRTGFVAKQMDQGLLPWVRRTHSLGLSDAAMGIENGPRAALFANWIRFQGTVNRGAVARAASASQMVYFNYQDLTPWTRFADTYSFTTWSMKNARLAYDYILQHPIAAHQTVATGMRAPGRDWASESQYGAGSRIGVYLGAFKGPRGGSGPNKKFDLFWSVDPPLIDMISLASDVGTAYGLGAVARVVGFSNNPIFAARESLIDFQRRLESGDPGARIVDSVLRGVEHLPVAATVAHLATIASRESTMADRARAVGYFARKGGIDMFYPNDAERNQLLKLYLLRQDVQAAFEAAAGPLGIAKLVTQSQQEQREAQRRLLGDMSDDPTPEQEAEYNSMWDAAIAEPDGPE